MINPTPKSSQISSIVSVKDENAIQRSQLSETEIAKRGVAESPQIEGNFSSEISTNNFSQNFDSNNNNSNENNIDSNDSFIESGFASHPNYPPSNKTYGLRPRTELRKPSYDCDSEDKELPVEVVRRPRGHNRGSLMSKYRRRTANARERHRMREINAAFSTLRGILPPLSNRRSSQVSMTKIRTLRLAANYIQALSDLLQETDSGRIKSDLSTFNSSLGLQHYSESLLLHKIQAAKTSSSTNFHASCVHKPKRQQSKNVVLKEGVGPGVGGGGGGGGGGLNLPPDEGRVEEDVATKFFRLDHLIATSNSSSVSDLDRNFSSVNSWDISHPSACDKDFISILEDDSTQSSDIEGSLNSWVDYKALDDLYFALN